MAFCKNCGKELKKGEKCNCAEAKETKKTTTKKSEGFDFAKTMVAIKDDLLKSIKNPIDVIKENVDENDMPKTYIMAALYALSFAIFFCGIFKLILPAIMSLIAMASGSLKSLGLGSLTKMKLPYFKIGIYGLIIGAVTIAAYAVVMLLVPAIFKNKKLDFKKSMTLTSSAMLPMLFVNLIAAILCFLNLDVRLTLIVLLAGNSIVTYNFAKAYSEIAEVESNKFGYTIALLVILASFITSLFVYVTAETFTNSMAEDMVKDNLDLDDLLD